MMGWVLSLLGTSMFLVGSSLNGSAASDPASTLLVGLANGSIWLCLGGGLVASFGAVALLDRSRVARDHGASR